jgi:RNA polymerase sigma factor (sigma-70 family)
MNPTLLSSLPEAKLTIAQEIACARTEKGREKLVLHTMRDAFYYAKGVSRSLLPDDELFSLAYSAVRHAANNYKPERNHRFAKSRFMGYAKPYIRGEISRAWRARDTVKNGVTVSMQSSREIGEVGEFLGDSVLASPIRLEDCFNDVCAGTFAVEPEFDAIDLRERWAMVKDVIDRELSDQEKMVLDLFYRGGFDFSKIGKMLGVSRSAIQFTHVRALKKVRCALMKNGRLFNS